jgi:methylenetetrahydrofolate--tRNA-(uracil-5-)-methyltransferase
MRRVIVVGGGLAGCEAAWQAAGLGVRVVLYEMRPLVMTAAHRTGRLAELVCSNSLGSNLPGRAPGLLKEEMRRLGSLILDCADRSSLPGGWSLVVDRERFAQLVTERVEGHPLIEVRREEVREIPSEAPVVIATGPLTHGPLAEGIRGLVGSEFLYFYDAVSPIVDGETVDRERGFRGSRYSEEPAYLNLPMTEEEYRRFWEALVSAERHLPHEFERAVFFEGCLPIEELARRGYLTLAYGPLRPTGLRDPRTGRRPFAVVQLRPENRAETMFSMVGFQTSLRWGEQRRVFRMIPGLEDAEFLRYGCIHRNTYINSPAVLLPTYQLREHPGILFAGQITGVEGYVESAASGLVAGLNAARLVLGRPPLTFPPETAIGALAQYITSASPRGFSPMNVNFGLFPPPEGGGSREERHARIVERALRRLREFASEHGLTLREGC